MPRKALSRSSAAAVVVFSFALTVHAQETVRDRTAVMDAQIEILRKQAELDTELLRSAGASLATLPQVLSVVGFDGRMFARLQLQNGLVSSYAEGDTIRPGMKIASIAGRQVSLILSGDKRKSRVVALEFAAGVTVPQGIPLPTGVMPRPVPKELLPDPPTVTLPVPYMPPSAKAAAPAAQPLAATPTGPAK